MGVGIEESMPIREVAEQFHVSNNTIRNWMAKLGFPKPYYIGGKPYWKALEIKLWQQKQEKNTEKPASEPKQTKTGQNRPKQAKGENDG